MNEDKIEILARKLHSWYLEAVKELKERRIKSLEDAFIRNEIMITPKPNYEIKIIDKVTDKDAPLLQMFYNPNAVKPFDELSEDQKFIDRYIAGRILGEKNE